MILGKIHTHHTVAPKPRNTDKIATPRAERLEARSETRWAGVNGIKLSGTPILDFSLKFTKNRFLGKFQKLV